MCCEIERYSLELEKSKTQMRKSSRVSVMAKGYLNAWFGKGQCGFEKGQCAVRRPRSKNGVRCAQPRMAWSIMAGGLQLEIGAR